MANPHRVSGYTPSPQARISSDHTRSQYRTTPHHSRESRPRYSVSSGPAPPPHTASGHIQHHHSPPAYRSQRSSNQEPPARPRQSRDGYPNQQPIPPQHRVSSSRLAQPVDGNVLRNRGLGSRPPVNASYAAHRNASLSRSRSLSRPERYRPRPGMLRNAAQPPPPQVPPHQGGLVDQGLSGYRHYPPRVGLPEQPMSSRLQMQLQQQKIQQQREAGLSMAPPQRKPSKKEKQQKEEDDADARTTWWAWIAFGMTCCIPGWCLRVCCRKQNALTRQAWREKIALVLLILLLCLALVYITYGLTRTLCPEQSVTYPYSVVTNGNRVPMYRKDVRVFGRIYSLDSMKSYFASKGLNLTDAFENLELGPVFDGDLRGACNAFGINAALGACRVDSPYGGTITGPNGGCLSLRDLNNYMRPEGTLNFEWADMDPKYSQHAGDLALLGNTVINMTTYFRNGTSVFGSTVDRVLQSNVGKDLSYVLLYTPEGKDAAGCLLARYSSGIIESEAGGCIASQIIMNIMLAVIVAMIVVRYMMALTFQWFIAGRLVKPGGRSNWLAWRSIKGGNDDPANHIPGPYNYYTSANVASSSSSSIHSSSSTRATPKSDKRLSVASDKAITTDIVNTELYTVMLVTCYSEGQEGLQTTMDSLAKTTYSRKHKLFFIIADGMITGAGEKRPTPDIVVDMMDLDPTMRDPKPAHYVAIADGEKQLNMAKVYAGHYRGVPCITIVKCGTEEEANKPKAGNRGKRDSQLIVMQFFQRVLFNDRLTELDYEIFWKMTWLMKGVTPDKFELILMVDADTKVLPDALTYMVAAMANDITIMGLCGETRIANKRASWVTAIQVFEYYISHNYAKAFESLFGIVTCLPGCFSMYRIKAPKNGAWVPILANPDIILEYNQNVVTTLHAKNLLLLGEDRFLSTLMLRTFPRRQMMFVPQARCKTVVPDQFKVLLSQRRRWINSTVHNLMELVLVSDLCGIACLSMQFSVFVDLIGTLVLPAAICLTIYLIVSTAVSSNPQWQSLALLVAILGLPAVLIGITTFKLVYIMWMLVYIIALPIWNFILPVYAYWHFDDFSWGATRKVHGEKKDKHDMDPEGKFDSSRLVMKKWEDWEAERTGQRLQPRNIPTLRTPMDPAAVPFCTSPPRSVTPLFSNRKMFVPPTPSNA